MSSYIVVRSTFSHGRFVSETLDVFEQHRWTTAGRRYDVSLQPRGFKQNVINSFASKLSRERYKTRSTELLSGGMRGSRKTEMQRRSNSEQPDSRSRLNRKKNASICPYRQSVHVDDRYCDRQDLGVGLSAIGSPKKAISDTTKWSTNTDTQYRMIRRRNANHTLTRSVCNTPSWFTSWCVRTYSEDFRKSPASGLVVVFALRNFGFMNVPIMSISYWSRMHMQSILTDTGRWSR
jgi:hypothetical protein